MSTCVTCSVQHSASDIFLSYLGNKHVNLLNKTCSELILKRIVENIIVQVSDRFS